jgi:hypothetical protein
MRILFCLFQEPDSPQLFLDLITTWIRRWPLGIYVLVTNSVQVDKVAAPNLEIIRIEIQDDQNPEKTCAYLDQVMSAVMEGFLPVLTVFHGGILKPEMFHSPIQESDCIHVRNVTMDSSRENNIQAGAIRLRFEAAVTSASGKGFDVPSPMTEPENIFTGTWEEFQNVITQIFSHVPVCQIRARHDVDDLEYETFFSTIGSRFKTIHISIAELSDLPEIKRISMLTQRYDLKIIFTIPTQFLFAISHKGPTHGLSDLLLQGDLIGQILASFRLVLGLKSRIHIKLINQSSTWWIKGAVVMYEYVLRIVQLGLPMHTAAEEKLSTKAK